jgi:Ser/Thr protein kinase RdoA (MazF antagonist)
MRLTRHNVISYLIAQNLLSPRAIVAESVTVIEASQRNNNFKVLTQAGDSYFVKQILDWSDNSREALRREACLHTLAADATSALHFFGPHLPHCHLYDPHGQTLTLALVPNSPTLSHLLAQPNLPLTETLAHLGRTLGHLHHRTRTQKIRAELAAHFEPWLPWAMSPDSDNTIPNEQPILAVAQLRRTLRNHPDIQHHLAQLSREWRNLCLVHNDLKGDHCLVSHAESPIPHPQSPTLVDWEMATLGEPRWDVGCVFALILLPWVELAAAQTASLATAALKAAQQRAHAFWDGYAAARSLAPSAWPAELQAAARYAAARLVQTAYEDAHVRDQLSPREVLLLQLGQNIFQRPAQAVQQVLGMRQ